ncbi:MAG TPA: DUF2911 domain-containing protein [Gemmatimonadaceae bacterium]|nr:DUF2911 domain-containing protein [Gemmatimonadaceae bacterium]
MNLPLVRLALLAFAVVSATPAADERAAFVTTLGRDTVALESFVRTATRVEGDIMVRIPGTVLCHYVLVLAGDGSVTRSTLDVKPIGISTLPERHVTIELTHDSIFADVDSAGHHDKTRRAAGANVYPQFMTGYGDSYGLYSSLGVYEALIQHLVTGTDTVNIPSVNMATGRTVPRQFLRRSPTAVDADYFNIAWTHLVLDAVGQIVSADGSETTEKVQSHRVDYLDVPQAAKRFAALDKEGKGLGLASPNVIAKGLVGGQMVVVTYGSPRRRDRTIVGNVVRYDKVWRTGANEATVIVFDKPMVIGTTTFPAGSYSLWTLPKKDGSVDLIVNSQHGQYGTDYDASHDIVHVPMKVATVAAPQDNFIFLVSGTDLSMSWDTFVWSVPISAK